MTNRELYLTTLDIIKRNEASDRTLEQYLSAVLNLVRPRAQSNGLPVDDFVQLLSDAFTAEPLPFDESWRTLPEPLDEDLPGFAGCETTLIRQIRDLRELEESKGLEGDFIELGINAPRGERWYNFHPASFLECGMEGAFRGWEEGDSIDRFLLIDQSAPLNGDGAADQGQLGHPVVEYPEISWEQFHGFLLCGQFYE